ncbi:MAG: hypothetical protein AABZ06_09690, partial [Bdellovibrionota bacterium]
MIYKTIVKLALFICIFCSFILNFYDAKADAYGAPGLPHRWAPALKQAIGTAYEPSTAASPVWFTISEGIISEVFYPT